MIKHVFRQKPIISNVLYNSQIGNVVCVCSLIYKVSSLPSLVADRLGSSTLWGYLFMTILDIISIRLSYAFCRRNGDVSLQTDAGYRIGIAILGCYFAFKGAVYFSFAVMYLSLELFTGISPIIVAILLTVPITYVGVKGIRTIARTCETFVFIVYLMIIVNLIFLKTDTDFNRNFPALSMPIDQLIKDTFRYGLWLGDLLPLIFVRAQNKRLPYVALSITFVGALVNLSVAVAVATYGDAMVIVNNFLVSTASFNQLSLEIGRLEWTALFAIIVMGILECALLFWGASECSLRVFGDKLPVQIAYPIGLIVMAIFVPSLQTVMDFAQNQNLGYVMTGLALGLPLYFNALRIAKNKKFLRRETVEYKRIPRTVQNEE